MASGQEKVDFNRVGQYVDAEQSSQPTLFVFSWFGIPSSVKIVRNRKSSRVLDTKVGRCTTGHTARDLIHAFRRREGDPLQCG